MAAVFAAGAYELNENSTISGNNSQERMENWAKSDAVKEFIGEGWQVQKSSQDAALVINDGAKTAVLTISGSRNHNMWTIARDWVGNNIAGGLGIYNRRVETLRREYSSQLNELNSNGYKVVVTGHSAGGSYATALSGTLNFAPHVRTWNSPELSYTSVKTVLPALAPAPLRPVASAIAAVVPNQYSSGREASSANTKHYRLEGDVVSHLTSPGERSFQDRGGIVLPRHQADSSHAMGSVLNSMGIDLSGSNLPPSADSK